VSNFETILSQLLKKVARKMPKQALALINKKLELPIGESSEFNFF
jgi:hypothetical protein